MVPEPARQVEEEGAHEEGPREAGAQRSPSDVLRGAHPSGGAAPQGDREAAQETAQESGEATAQAGRQGGERGLGHPSARMGVAAAGRR